MYKQHTFCKNIIIKELKNHIDNLTKAINLIGVNDKEFLYQYTKERDFYNKVLEMVSKDNIITSNVERVINMKIDEYSEMKKNKTILPSYEYRLKLLIVSKLYLLNIKKIYSNIDF
ncbi:hypothetical protein [Clostridium perfringens]|uniref:hypothetical protein n=1 Tax=Clostridium perfringens TaxID=1502 RepID=UPI0013E2A9B7|nr:hypothetical protein [Clostridium perfringens]MDK0637107.1 hypothetical protein [Clostridium perfringens]NGT04448.1 hypothetical protein [Clostridium perfringens]